MTRSRTVSYTHLRAHETDTSLFVGSVRMCIRDSGRTVDFKNTVIVMTSNIGSHMIQAMVNRSYDEIKEAVWDDLKNHFRPEFLNRIDETVVFHGLDAKHIEKIAAIQLRILEQRLAKMDLKLQVS